MDDSSIFKIALEHGTFSNLTEHPQPPYAELPDDCIRLLEILPGPAGSEISCQIVSVPLHDRPTYSALSYLWGSGTDTCAIWLNGHRVHIRKNLWRFLDQAKQLGSHLFGSLWIDALCINQSNSEERTRQVNLMTKIYSAAREVVVWLGPAHGESDMAMRELSKSISYWRAKSHLSKIWNRPAGSAIRRLCTRRYWTRLWILQELLLARKIRLMCGSKVTRWELFRDFLLETDKTGLTDRSGGQFEYEAVRVSPAAFMVRQNIDESFFKFSLWNLIFATQHLRCAEIRDKVYALLGVANFADSHIIPDYNIPIPALLNLVLRDRHKFQSPRNLTEVGTQCQQLTTLFGADPGSIFLLTDYGGSFPVPPIIDMEGEFSYKPARSPVNLWWTSFYRHDCVQRLLFRSKTFTNYQQKFVDAIEQGNLAAVRLWTTTGNVELDSKSYCRQTPLLLATKNMNAAIVKLLLATGKVNVNSRDGFGLTPMGWALFNMDRATIKLLLDTGKVNHQGLEKVKDDAAFRQLQIALEDGNETIAKLLLDTGGLDITSEHGTGSEALHMAVENCEKPIIQLLLDTNQVDVNS